MNSTQIYDIIVDDIFFAFFLFRVSSTISIWIQNRTFFLVLKYLMYSLLWKRHDLIDSFNRKRFLLIIVYWFEIVACNLVDINTFAQIETKTNIFSTIHLISFVYVNRLSFVVDVLEFSLRTYLKLHSSFNIMIFAQVLIYVVIFLFRNFFHFKKSFQFYEFLMSFFFFQISSLHWRNDKQISSSFRFWFLREFVIISMSCFWSFIFFLHCLFSSRYENIWSSNLSSRMSIFW